MSIWISSLKDAHQTVESKNPTKIVSLLSPGSDFPDFEGFGADRHHRIEVYDILEDAGDRVAPNEDHVAHIIELMRDWQQGTPLFVHCWAGMSRSTASAYIAACLHNPQADEEKIAQHLADASPTAFPNTRIVAIADEMLGRDGRMARAAEKIRGDEKRLAKIYELQESVPFSIPSTYAP